MWEKVSFGVDVSCDIIMSSKVIKWISHPYACICLCYIWLHLIWRYFMVHFLVSNFFFCYTFSVAEKKLAFPEYKLNLNTLVNCLMAIHCSCFTFFQSWGDITISLSWESCCSWTVCSWDRPQTAQGSEINGKPCHCTEWQFWGEVFTELIGGKLCLNSEHWTTANYSIY